MKMHITSKRPGEHRQSPSFRKLANLAKGLRQRILEQGSKRATFVKKYSGIENRQSRRKRMPRNEAVARRAMSIFETTLNVEKRRSLRVTSTVGTAANLQGGRGRVQ